MKHCDNLIKTYSVSDGGNFPFIYNNEDIYHPNTNTDEQCPIKQIMSSSE